MEPTMPRLLNRLALLCVLCLQGPLQTACATAETTQEPAAGPSSAVAPLQDLFNGKDLRGWVATGNADAWAVRDGEIHIVKPGTGGWLRTDRTFRDFELELDFWLPPNGNSGVGLRGSSHGDPAFTGFEVQILDTHGQTPDLRNCGAVYEAVAPLSMAVTQPGHWNTYRIRLVGDTLNVWLNGEQIHRNTKLDDRGFFRTESNPLPLNTRATTGYIALQDHGQPFRYKNIRIRDLSVDPEPAGFIHLIGSTLDGWHAEDAATWSIEDGRTLTGRGGPGHLFSSHPVRDFELRSLVRVNTRGNSGIYFRVRPNPAPNNPWPIGYEAQIDNHDPKNFTGVIYDKAWSSRVQSPLTRDNAWFDYRIRVQGNRVRTWINGQPTVDAELDEFTHGVIAVQGHHPGNVIEFRDLRVLDLSAADH
jgi:hypothetical protein